MRQDVFDMTGRVVVITGGLGQLGREYSLELLRRGGRVAILDIQEPARADLGFIDHADADGNTCYLQADVTDRGSLEAALGEIASRWEAPSGLVNNAAIDSPPNAPMEENGPFEDYPEESFERIMDANVKGVLLACQVFGKAMAEAGRGSIVNIGSIYGQVSPDQRLYDYRKKDGKAFFKPVAYSVSKSALGNLTRYLATYWAPKVRVNTMTLGGVFNNQDQVFLEGYAARTPMGRMAGADEYRGGLVFLLSDASSYMTGANLVMDGGWTAW